MTVRQKRMWGIIVGSAAIVVFILSVVFASGQKMSDVEHLSEDFKEMKAEFKCLKTDVSNLRNDMSLGIMDIKSQLSRIEEK